MPLFHRRESIAIIFTLLKQWWYFAMAFFYYFLVLCSCQFLRSGAFAAALALARLFAPPANRTHHFYCSFESASRCLHELTPVFSTKYHRCVSAWRTQYLFAITIFSGDVINAEVFKIYMRYTNTCMCVWGGMRVHAYLYPIRFVRLIACQQWIDGVSRLSSQTSIDDDERHGAPYKCLNGKMKEISNLNRKRLHVFL